MIHISDLGSSITSPVYRRGPVIVSSDEESESERPALRPLRALSRTPSWAKSPSPGPGEVIAREDVREGVDGAGSENEVGSEVGDGFVGSRASPRWGSVFSSERGSDSDSGESGRIRIGRIVSPGEFSEDDWDEGSGPEGESRGASPKVGLEHDTGPRSRSPSHATDYMTPDEHPDSSSESVSSGSDTEQYHSASFEVENAGLNEDPDSDSPQSVMEKPEYKSPRHLKIKGRRRGKQVDRFNPDYVTILNEEIIQASSREVNEFRKDIVSKKRAHNKHSLEASWILGSLWTADEKNAFFKHLSVVGKDNVPELTSRIGTKSIVECRAYIKALQDGKEDNVDFPIVRSSRGRDLVSAKDIPAAIELSEECVEALEENADLLEERTLRDEERREKVKWGDYWIVESATAWHLESLYQGGNIKEIHEIAPEAELLNVYNMLDLSESIFMNGPGQANWQELSAEPPSIRRTALSDIHTLVVSLTRRIVQTTLFMAMSRVRCTDSKVFGTNPLVRPVDVEAAVNCLGLREGWKEYWLKLPRKVGLRVYNRKEDIRKNSDVNVLPYEKVEQLLAPGGRWLFSNLDSGQISADGRKTKINMDLLVASAYVEGDEEEVTDDELSSVLDEPMNIENSGLDTSADDDEEDNHAFVKDDVERAYRSKFQRKQDARARALEKIEDLFMEAVDQKQSLEAEKALWEMMAKEPNKPLPEEIGELPQAPPLEKKRALEVLDWRDGVEYVAPWETTKRRRTEPESKGDATPDILSAVPLSKLYTVMKLQEARTDPGKPAAKRGGQQLKVNKLPSPVNRSPRKPRARRQSKAFSGYVSTIENVVESDAEALAREQEGDDSSEEHHRDS